MGVHRVGAEPLEGEGGLGLGAGLGQGLPHQAQVQRAGVEQPREQAQPAEFGEERTVDAAGFPLVGTRAQPFCGQLAQFGTPGALLRSE